jgi:hypothetical protein
MANAVMTNKVARSFVRGPVSKPGLIDTDAWSKKIAGPLGLSDRVSGLKSDDRSQTILSHIYGIYGIRAKKRRTCLKFTKQALRITQL